MTTSAEIREQLKEAIENEKKAQNHKERLEHSTFPLKDKNGEVLYETKEDMMEDARAFWRSPWGKEAINRALLGRTPEQCREELKEENKKEDGELLQKGQA